jgi:uncharacterized membrane protein
MFPKFSNIKSEAKYALNGLWGKTAWKEFLLFITGGTMSFGLCLYELIGLLILNIIARTSESEWATHIDSITLYVILHVLISVVRMCLASGMKIGMNKYYLELAEKPSREPQTGLTSHMKYFANHFIMIAARDIYASILTLFCIIPGIISYMKWSMAHFVIAEDAETHPSESMIESGYTMDGYKWKYFLFNLSFIPLIIVSTVSVIGLFFTIPYIKMAQAKFYYYIKHPVYDKDKDLNELKTLQSDKFSFDDFVAEYEDKIARKQQRRK